MNNRNCFARLKTERKIGSDFATKIQFGQGLKILSSYTIIQAFNRLPMFKLCRSNLPINTFGVSHFQLLVDIES